MERLKYYPPDQEDEFVDLCLHLLRVHWKCRTLEIYAKRGEEQHGIDIIDLGGTHPLRAAQCKCYDPKKSLPPAEIKAEVEKAKGFDHPLGHYAILTTAKVSSRSQDAIAAINREHREKKLFRVELLAWDQIKSLLSKYPEVAEPLYGPTYYQEIKAMQRDVSFIRTGVESLVDEKGEDKLHAEIDQGRHYLEKREYQTARLVLQRLRERSWDDFTPRHKFRLLTNLGFAYLREGDTRQGVSLLFEARAWQPDDEKALANEVLGHHLLGEREQAYALASQYRSQFQLSGKINALWISNAPQSVEVQDFESQLSPSLLNDADVCVALGERAFKENRLGKAEECMRRAISVNPDLPYPHLLLAKTLLRQLTSGLLEKFGEITLPSGQTALDDLETECTRAIELSRQEKASDLVADALLTRAFFREISGNRELADRDLEQAHREMPHHREVKRDYAQLLLRRGNKNEAIRLLREVSETDDTDKSSYLLAMALRERSSPGDLREAIEILIRIATGDDQVPFGFKEEVIAKTLDLVAREQAWEKGEELLESLADHSISPVAMYTFKATLQLHQGDEERAGEFVNKAVSGISQDTSRSDKRRLASLLSRCGRHKHALPLWRELADPSVDSKDTRQLLECLRRLGLHGEVLGICETLRESGTTDESLLDLEVSLLERYQPEKAVDLLRNYIKDHPEDQLMRLRLSLIGIRLNKDELITSNPTNVPSVGEIRPFIGHAVVRVLREAGHPNEALNYAYELLRRNFDEIEARRAYLAALHPVGPRPDVDRAEAAGLGTAVLFSEKGTENRQWVVIEDSANPGQIHDELSPDHHLAKQLLGKRKGDEFVLAESEVSKRVGVIEGVLNKYVYRYQQLMDRWQLDFPESPDVQVVRLPRTEGTAEEPGLDISPILKSIDRRHEQIEKLKEAYRSGPLPIQMFGDALGMNAFEATCAIAVEDDLNLNCCLGSAEEREAALKALADCNSIVIDLVSLATLFLLERYSLLEMFSKRFLVAQATITELEQVVKRKTPLGVETGAFTKVDGKYLLVEHSEEDRQKYVKRLREFICFVTSCSQVMSCRAVAALDPEKRDALTKGVGQHGTESMILASAPGHLLWTDDNTLARLAKGESGVQRVWTQVALQSLAEEGLFPGQDFFEACAKLLGFRYVFTSPSVPVYLKAGKIAEWDVDRWPLNQALDLFVDESISLEDALRLAAQLMVSMYKEALVPERTQSVILRILDRIGKRRGGLGGIRSLAKALPTLFGLDVVRGKEAQKIILSWLASAEGQIEI